MRRTPSFASATSSVVVSVIALVAAAGARGETFALSYVGRATEDPAVRFAQECSGDVLSEDCDTLAAALEAELVDLLAALSDETDPATAELFSNSVEFPAARVQEAALEYLAAQDTPPEGFWDRARQFFLGPEPMVGFPAATLLGRSSDDTDLALADRYLAGRTDTTHGGFFPAGAGATDSWAVGHAHDLALDKVVGFGARERFPGAARLLMIDRVTPDFVTGDPEREVVATGFVTGAEPDTVIAHFTAVFGREPYLSLNDGIARTEAISAEMEALQEDLENGDPDALDRVIELSEELTAINEGVSVGTRLNLQALEVADHVFWSDLAPDTAFEGPMRRSASVGVDPTLGRTVILLFSGARGAGGGGEGEGEGEGEGDLFGPDDDDDGAAGCGCEASGGPAPAALWGAAAAGLALGARMRRRNHGRPERQ